MNTLVRIITASIIAIFLTSCNFDINFDPGIIGDGNVITKTREVISNFETVKVSRGIDVILTQGNTISLEVKADRNLHNVITTEFDEDNNMLRISANENIKSSASKKVILTVKDIASIITTSGSNVYSESSLNTNELNLSSTSGSHIDLDIDTNVLKIKTTSGAGIDIKGTTKNMNIAATSGSYIRASRLKAESTTVSATSGASISVNTIKVLKASATSGASIKYEGNPDKVDKNSGVSGSIKKV
ncbi:MAG: DUF2807 domain-containing protein [Winogradskyella sp.]|uniref:head GIN domain-containing protein n=1 Tax=Winogradskyella sp. TaxID=1883156 RepID=UPI0017BA4315|nr:head GIN domain-containing protein [Winogradskyella sp.]MBT8244203.1 DUF2807 domain-containing protein [Winogradskyella sp.]NNK21908.1 DUF2807 domain-containing protein [Winogradskyella sp.]